tara:strand:- start:48 stop:656 length:609 start_codon:yes stop_codon:yes gene_type:complete
MNTQYFDESFWDDYLFTKKFTPVKDIEKDCLEVEEIINKQFGHASPATFRNAPLTTKLFQQYNLLSFPKHSFHEVYSFIKECVDNLPLEPGDRHHIQCWLNVYTKNSPNLLWHGHWKSKYEVWHGFFCASVPEPSGTTYRLPTEKEDLYIPSVEGKMVIGKSDGDVHKSTTHSHESPRITIAFDIVPCRFLHNRGPNHWIPI